MFPSCGYLACPKYFQDSELSNLLRGFDLVHDQAQKLLRQIQKNGGNFADFYSEDRDSLIVVPEATDPAILCRFEYIVGSFPKFGQWISKLVGTTISELVGQEFILFKDKCHIKAPRRRCLSSTSGHSRIYRFRPLIPHYRRYPSR